MRIYKGSRSTTGVAVTVDGHPLTAKRPSYDSRIIAFIWGEESNGSERLALSILADCIGDEHAQALARSFMQDVVRKLDPDWEITSEDIEEWKNFTCQIGFSAQQAVWTAVGSESRPQPQSTASATLPFSRLLANPNYRLSSPL